MPLKRCRTNGKLGWRWGRKGKCYGGSRGRTKALRQARAIRASDYVENVFCPTGEGGGVDPTCSPSGQETWQMSLSDYEKSLKGQRIERGTYYNRKGAIRAKHYQSVVTAIQLGKPVPKSVVEFYRNELQFDKLLTRNTEGVWRTIRGNHVFIEDGVITKGPKELLHKNIQAMERKERETKGVTLFHETSEDALESIRKSGLKTAKHLGPRWYTTTDKFEGAVEYTSERDDRVILEFGLSGSEFKKRIWPYPGDSEHYGNQFALKDNLPAKLLIAVHRKVKGKWVRESLTENVYCPTGEGGGIDPTCSPGSKYQSHLQKSLEESRRKIKELSPSRDEAQEQYEALYHRINKKEGFENDPEFIKVRTKYNDTSRSLSEAREEFRDLEDKLLLLSQPKVSHPVQVEIKPGIDVHPEIAQALVHGGVAIRPWGADESRWVSGRYKFVLDRVIETGSDKQYSFSIEAAHPLDPVPKNTIPEIPDNPNSVYRGMSREEWDHSVERGVIQSIGDHNLDQEGLTFYGRAATGSHYASGFAPTNFMPTPGRPAVVIEIPRSKVLDYKDLPDKIPQGEYAHRGGLDLSEIKNRYNLVATSYKPGNITLAWSTSQRKIREVGAFPPRVNIAIVPVIKSKITHNYDPDQPRDPAGTSTGGRWSSQGGVRDVDKYDLKLASQSESEHIRAAITESLKVGEIRLKLRSVQVVEVMPVSKNEGGLGYSNGNIYITREFLDSVKSHNSQDVVKELTGTGANYNFAWQAGRSPEEAIRIAVAHEVGHHVETALMLDLGKAGRTVIDSGGNLQESELVKVSGYASTHPVELFAELHALEKSDRQDLIPSDLRKYYREAIKTADPNPIVTFIANTYNPNQPREPKGSDIGGQWTKAGASGTKQTDTPEFKRWFGKSKVVDEDGNPLVVYHGSPHGEIAEFDLSRAGTNTLGFADESRAIHFADNPEFADTYSRAHENFVPGYKIPKEKARDLGLSERIEHPSAVTPVYLSIQNPIYAGNSNNITAVFIERAKAAGHDGITADTGMGMEYVVFDPRQIKSAIGNRGTFDPDNPNITNVATDKRRTLISNASSYDPTRTITLRRVFSEEFGKRFNCLKRSINALIVEEDAFGLKGQLALNAEDESKGVWRTIRGAKVFIEDGVITKGPRDLIEIPDQIDEGTILSEAEATSLIEKIRAGDLRSKNKGVVSRESGINEPMIVAKLPISYFDRVDSYGENYLDFIKDSTDPKRVAAYANNKIKTPVVVHIPKRSGQPVISDGGHRLMAAVIRGDKSIRALLPLSFYKKHLDITVNVRWKFLSSLEKINQFKAWLARQVQFIIFGSTTQQIEESWWQQFVERGYEQGANRAFIDVRKTPALTEIKEQAAYEGARREFLRGAFGQPTSIEKVKLLAGRVYSDLRGITEQMSAGIARELTDGIARGDHPLVIARKINQNVEGIGKQRAQVLARTEIIRAHAEGQLDALKRQGITHVGVAVEWSTAEDNAVCKLCEPLDGVILTVEEAHGLIPRHPNCVIGETEIRSDDALAILKTHYTGQIVELVTAKGRRLSVTPNHILLTEYGFIPAVLAYQGLKILCESDAGTVFNTPDNHANKTGISDVFAAAQKDPTMLSECMPLSPEYLHGDGGTCNSEVSIIWPDSKLRGKSQVFGEIIKGSLISFQGISREGGLPRTSAGAEFFKRVALASDSSMGRFRELAALFSGSLLHPQEHGFTSVSWLDANTLQSYVDSAARTPEMFRDCVAAHPTIKHLADFIYGQLHIEGISFGKILAEILKSPLNSIKLDPKPFSDVIASMSLFIKCDYSFDEVVGLRFSHVESLPVYDVTADSTLYSANGIVTSNCRCSWIPANVGENKKGQIRGQRKIVSAFAKSVSAERPKRKKRTLREQIRRSKWQGAGRRIKKSRPTSILDK